MAWIHYTGCPNKKETGTNMPISLKLDRHLNNFGYYLLDSYPLFPTVPRNAGSFTSVINEHKHFNKKLTNWLCTKSFNCLWLCWQIWNASTLHDVLTKDQIVFTVTDWYRTGSLQKLGNRFAHQFPGRPGPVKSTIWKNVHKYQRKAPVLTSTFWYKLKLSTCL